METEVEFSNNVTTNIPSASSVLKGSSPSSEACDIPRFKANKTKISNKRKKIERNILPSSVSNRNETSEDCPISGRPLCGKSELDLLIFSDTNRYDRTLQGPFDVIIQSPENSTSLIDPIAIGRLLFSISKKEIVEIKKLN